VWSAVAPWMNGNQPRLVSTSLFIGLKMPNRPKRPRDFSQAAKLVIDIATGQLEASEDEFMFANARLDTRTKEARG
jgi:hypothetical protein